MLGVVLIVGGGWLGIEHERDRKETFDPFYQLVTTMGL